MSARPDLLQMTIAAILKQWPDAVHLLRHYKMNECIGCYIAPFCTLAEALEIYGVSPAAFLADLAQIIDPPAPP